MNSENKRASWLELFYDLAFVALVAQLTHIAVDYHSSWEDIFHIFIIGYSLFVAWWATTANRNLQPKETTTDKLLIQLQMVTAFMMSVTMSGVFYGDYVGFFASLAALRLLQAFMLLKMYAVYPDTRPATYNIIQGFLLAAVLWFIAGFLPSPLHLVVATAALAIDVLTPVTRGKGNTKRYLNVYHLQERLGLFLMLAIGESMIVVALSNTATELSLREPAVLFSGLLLMIALWWLYFEHSDRHLGVRPKDLFIFLHAHAILFGSLILISAGYKLLLTEPTDSGLLSVFVGATGIAASIGVIRAMLYPLRGRAVIISTIVVLLFGIVFYFGFFQGRIISSVVGVSVLFTIIALLDYGNFFGKISKKIEKKLD